MCRRIRAGFTLIELLIVVVILGILAALALPHFWDASDDARLAALAEDLRSVRMAIARYTVDHDGRVPCIDDKAKADNNAKNFIDRLTGRTTKAGAISATGKYGPYLNKFPTNPYASPPAQAANVKLGTANPPNGAAGWYLNSATYKFSANTAGQETL